MKRYTVVGAWEDNMGPFTDSYDADTPEAAIAAAHSEYVNITGCTLIVIAVLAIIDNEIVVVA